MGSAVLSLVRSLSLLARAVRKETNASSLRGPAQGIALVLVFLTLVIARHTEHSRRRVRDSAAELLGARLALVGALLLSWLAKRLVPDRERFGKTVFSTRCRVFHQCCTPQVPLVVISTLWEDERVAVVHTTCDNFSFLRLLAGPHVWFVVSSHWAKLRSHFRWHRALAILLDPFQRCDQVLWLGNSPQEVLVARREGCQTAFVNHNCFVNESCFPLASFRARPRFDAVLNANAGAWKRHHLARAVPTLAYITYSRDAHGRMVWPVESFRPAFQNDEYLDERARSTIYRDSCCGLTLSACEGANYATGVVLTEEFHLNRRHFIPEATTAVLLARTEEVVLPGGSRVRAFRWRRNTPAQREDCDFQATSP